MQDNSCNCDDCRDSRRVCSMVIKTTLVKHFIQLFSLITYYCREWSPFIFLCFRIPAYGELKLAFLVYLWYPKTKVYIHTYIITQITSFSCVNIIFHQQNETISSISYDTLFLEKCFLLNRVPMRCMMHSCGHMWCNTSLT